MDTLSDVLSAVRLSGGAFLNAEFTAPWCIAAKVGPEDCRPLGAVPAHLIAYHYVVRGRLVVEVAGKEPLELVAGDLILLPRNERHVLGSAAGLDPIVPDELVEPPAAGGLASLRYGGGGEETQIVCGFIGCEMPDHPLLATLPVLLKIGAREGVVGEWLRCSFHLAVEEFSASRPGSATVLGKLAELLFVEAVRRHLETLPGDSSGWLAGLRDKHVGPALTLLHARPAHPWTTESLAREVGLSRSAFAERFTALVGVPPMRYLASWRMQLAALRLRESGRSTAQIAFEVGYESDAAFNRAFKRIFGITPASWRRRGDAQFLEAGPIVPPSEGAAPATP